MKLKMACAVFATTAVCVYGWSSLPGQETGASEDSGASQGIMRKPFAPEITRHVPRYLRVKLGPPIVDAESAVQEAVQRYRDADGDQGKEQAKEAMSTALSEYFDADMNLREEEIRDIEERVKKLQAQLERRSEAKAKLVELQLQVLVNEAEGLGFYGGSSAKRGFADQVFSIPIEATAPATRIETKERRGRR